MNNRIEHAQSPAEAGTPMARSAADDVTVHQLFRGYASVLRFTGIRWNWHCDHKHETPKAAAFCTAQWLRRTLPNSRDKVQTATYALNITTGVSQRQTWTDDDGVQQEAWHDYAALQGWA